MSVSENAQYCCNLSGFVLFRKISLTDKGYPIARRIYDRHLTLTRFFVSIGVDEVTARKDACKVEHDISEETFSMICKQLEKN